MKGMVSCGSRMRTLVCALATLLIAGAAHAQPSPHDRATIHPSIVNVEPGATQQFKVVMLATRLMAAQLVTDITWSVNDIPGGNAEVGTISEEGTYTAPDEIPSPREVHIVAEAPDAANRWLFATVIVGEGRPVYRPHHIWSEPVIEGQHRSEHLESPHGIGLDVEGNILIADQETGVHRYTAEGEYIGRVDNGIGAEPGEVQVARMVTSDSDGRIFVSDSKGDRPRLQIFSHEGEFQQIFAEKGRPPGMLLRAHGMDFDRDEERLFVVDVDNMRVNVYTTQGEHLHDWGTEGMNPGEFNAPHGLFVDRSNDVFVSSYYGPTQKFDSEGRYLTTFGYGDPPDGPVYFHCIAGDKWGNAYLMVRTKAGYQGVLSSGGPRNVSIMKFNNNGDFVTEWAFSAEEHTETTAVISDDGLVYALFHGPHEMGVEVFEEE